jgi:hypothetical protein
MEHITKLAFLTLLTILSAFCACQRPPSSRGEAVTRMVQLQESGRYDAAVRVVEEWMNQHQNETSQNDFLHQQIAMVYISKAYRKQSTRNESIAKAASHLEQALNLYAATKPEDVDTSLFGIGGAYEILGDLSQEDKCRFYGKARSAFDEQLPLIKGDSYTAYGKTVALEPLRAEIRKHITSVEEKSGQAGCTVR